MYIKIQESIISYKICIADFETNPPNIKSSYPTLKKKTEPKSRYFAMFESTFEKCLIQLSVELIQSDIAYDSNKFIKFNRIQKLLAIFTFTYRFSLSGKTCLQSYKAHKKL